MTLQFIDEIEGLASADYAAAPIERPQAFEKASTEDFHDEAGHLACGYTLVNICSAPSTDVFEENLCVLDHFYSRMEDKSHPPTY